MVLGLLMTCSNTDVDPLGSNTTPLYNSARVGWIDAARGIGITLVVFGHTMRGIRDAGLMTWSPAARFVDAWIYTFHMPLFFFLSGMFLMRSLRRGIKTFLLEKLRTVAYPYFLWSIITLIIKLPLEGVTNQET